MMLQLAPEPPTVERRGTATSVIRLPRYFGHLFSAQQNDHTFPYLKKKPLMRSPALVLL